MEPVYTCDLSRSTGWSNIQQICFFPLAPDLKCFLAPYLKGLNLLPRQQEVDLFLPGFVRLCRLSTVSAGSPDCFQVG